MTVLTTIAKQLLILEDKLSARAAKRAVVRASVLDARAEVAYARAKDAAVGNVQQLSLDGAALVQAAEQHLADVKARVATAVRAAEVHPDLVRERLVGKADKHAAKASAHTQTRQKAREAHEVL